MLRNAKRFIYATDSARFGLERRLSITGVRKIIDQTKFLGNFSLALQEFLK